MRKFVDNLGKMLHCDHPGCKWHPLINSPLEKWFALLLLSLQDTLVPFQLLTKKHFDEYFKVFCADVHTCGLRGDYRRTAYDTNVWQIYATQTQVLMTRLLGVNRMTRYMHVLTSCGMFFIEMAHKFKATPRGLFGADGTEITNDDIKHHLRLKTGKFGCTQADLDTLVAIIRWHLWEHLIAREENPLIDTAQQQADNLKKQEERDLRTLRAGDELRAYFTKHNVAHIPTQSWMITKFQKTNLCKWLVLDDEHQTLRNMATEMDIEKDNDDVDFWMNGRDEDEINYLMDELENVQFDDPELESKTDADKTFHSMDIMDFRIGRDLRESNEDDVDDYVGRWRDVHFATDQNHRVSMGLRDIIIEGFFPKIGHPDQFVEQQFKWTYRQLFAVAISYSRNKECRLYFKFVDPPTIKVRNTTNGRTWKHTSCFQTLCAQELHLFGFLRVVVPSNCRAELQSWWTNSTALRVIQQKCEDDMRDLPPEIMDTERDHVELFSTTQRTTLMGVHQVLDKEIAAHFERMDRGQHQKCWNCRKNFGWYETHAICILADDKTCNMGSMIFGALGSPRRDAQPDDLNITESLDPARAADTVEKYIGQFNGHVPFQNLSALELQPLIEMDIFAQCTLGSCRLFWVPVMLNTFSRCVNFVMTKLPGNVQKCNKLHKWSLLALKPKRLIKEMDSALMETLDELPGHVEIPFRSRKHFIMDMFAVLSGIFTVEADYLSQRQETDLHVLEILDIDGQPRVFWRLHLDLNPARYCNGQQFIEWGIDICKDYPWSFWKPLQLQCKQLPQIE